MPDSIQLAYREIVPDNNVPVFIRAEKPSQVVGDRGRLVADTGLTITAFLSLSKTQAAAAITGTTITVTEIGGGDYYNEIPGSVVTSQLTVYVDTATPIFLIAKDGTSVRQVLECRVVSSRGLRIGA